MCKPFSIAATPAPLVVSGFNIKAILYMQLIVQALFLLLASKVSWEHVHTLPEMADQTDKMTTEEFSVSVISALYIQMEKARAIWGCDVDSFDSLLRQCVYMAPRSF